MEDNIFKFKRENKTVLKQFRDKIKIFRKISEELSSEVSENLRNIFLRNKEKLELSRSHSEKSLYKGIYTHPLFENFAKTNKKRLYFKPEYGVKHRSDYFARQLASLEFQNELTSLLSKLMPDNEFYLLISKNRK